MEAVGHPQQSESTQSASLSGGGGTQMGVYAVESNPETHMSLFLLHFSLP